MGGPLPLRTGAWRATAAILGVRRAAPLAHRRAVDGTPYGAVALFAALAQFTQRLIRRTGKTSRPRPGDAVYGGRPCLYPGRLVGSRAIRCDPGLAERWRRGDVAPLWLARP